MVFRCYAVVSALLVATYLAWPEAVRVTPFLIVTFSVIPAVVVGAHRSRGAAKRPWRLLLGAMVSFNAGNVLWIWYVYADGRTTGDGTPADLLFNLANVLLLGSAIVVVLGRGRRDIGGVIDSVITALALGGLLWSALLLPFLTSAGTPMGRQVALFIDVFVMIGTLGALLRLSLAATERLVAVWLLTVGLGCGLTANLFAAFFTDPVTGARPDWTNLPFLAGYAALGCAALHPSAALITKSGAAPHDDLSGARMGFLGAMLAVIPLVGGGRVIFGLPTDGLLIALGSAGVIPLVMLRVARLAAQRRSAERELHRLATSDSLTGLPNRAACLDHLTAELARDPRELTVLFGDLDGFKPVNDRLGHAAGDDLLVAVADRLRGCVRGVDLVSRFGGDEFVIVCRGADALEVVTGRIREAVGRSFPAGGEQVGVGISLGAARARPGDSTDDLIRRADLAMYTAKKSKAVGALSLALAA